MIDPKRKKNAQTELKFPISAKVPRYHVADVADEPTADATDNCSGDYKSQLRLSVFFFLWSIFMNLAVNQITLEQHTWITPGIGHNKHVNNNSGEWESGPIPIRTVIVQVLARFCTIAKLSFMALEDARST